MAGVNLKSHSIWAHLIDRTNFRVRNRVANDILLQFDDAIDARMAVFDQLQALRNQVTRFAIPIIITEDW